MAAKKPTVGTLKKPTVLKKPVAPKPAAKKTQVNNVAGDDAKITVSVSTVKMHFRRIRAGIEFTKTPKVVEVTPEQLAVIQSDPVLNVVVEDVVEVSEGSDGVFETPDPAEDPLLMAKTTAKEWLEGKGEAFADTNITEDKQ